MRQRLGIAQALFEQPRFVILDEPTRGLDEKGQKEIVDLIHRLRQQSKTILITSHYIHEWQNLCDKVFTMSDGYLSKKTNF